MAVLVEPSCTGTMRNLRRPNGIVIEEIWLALGVWTGEVLKGTYFSLIVCWALRLDVVGVFSFVFFVLDVDD